jgi:hypothetical protein
MRRREDRTDPASAYLRGRTTNETVERVESDSRKGSSSPDSAESEPDPAPLPREENDKWRKP